MTAQELLNAPIFLSHHTDAIGYLAGFIFQPDRGEIQAIIVKSSQLWPRQTRFVPKEHILHLSTQGIEIDAQESLLTREQAKLFRSPRPPKKLRLLGLLALGSNGQVLGWLSDVEIHPELLTITNFYTQPASLPYIKEVLPKRILPRSRVIQITDRTITFDVDPREPLDVRAVGAVPAE